ncbi:MAG: hypothetical protein ABFC24_10730 [Methanoregulaceae archaeon]
MPEETEPKKELYDVLVPPGVPRKIIVDVMKKFDVQLVERSVPLSFANMDNDARELLAFRGTKEVSVEVEKYILEKLNEFIAEK